MSSLFYLKLAIQNIKKNRQTYLPYLLTCIGSVMVFDILLSIASNPELEQMHGGSNMRLILYLGCIVMGIFTGGFLLYTNSFLIKRRKREIALFNILGMEKKHIGRILFFETVMIGAASLAAGIFGGFLLSKGVYLLLLRLIQEKVTWGFHFSWKAAGTSAFFYGCLFLAILVANWARVQVASPAVLLRGGMEGEKEPKTKWLAAFLGILFLGMGYAMALTTKNILFLIPGFFLATLWVIAGTYFLFTAGSIALLKFLKKRKSFYYQTKHFISVSGMLYRMKQNAAGLAGICILSTSVMVILSSTVSLYGGLGDVLRNRFVRDIYFRAGDVSGQVMGEMDRIAKKVLESEGLAPEHGFGYKSGAFTVLEERKNLFVPMAGNQPKDMGKVKILVAIAQEDYNKLTESNLHLNPGEAVVMKTEGRKEKSGEGAMSLFGKTYQVMPAGKLKLWDGDYFTGSRSVCYVILPNMEDLEYLATLEGSGIQYQYGFDLNADKGTQVRVYGEMMEKMNQLSAGITGESVAMQWKEYLSFDASLLFLGIFLGTIFLMAAVLIIYYKQVTEGYDDKARFEIMQKVGLSKAEIGRSIRSQMLLMFFLPLAAAAFHMVFAFPIMVRLLAVMNLTNVRLFAWCSMGTFGVFAVVYWWVYVLTSRVYVRIVS